ncbi:exocyst complex component Sec15 isoform X2 [Bombus vancouverensis nearcticus]|uniref:Exocyst complex component n=2 Tax=Pyrobombus TaxID=144703 RepID=A0A6P8LGA2_9HYME|nr:exocyst complex component 6 isoform X2 [Bombus impatiens]XP_033195469.1 exocyst complex component 6 isoform X2 [Bombus vancouverensis nearcticus]XP_033297189.1 exocyst complex component 6 isoform X2 [Bombus bifarius]
MDLIEMQRYDILIQEIEGIDDYLGPTFRAIYDGHEHQKFMEKLDERIKAHDKDIERMCNHHYQGFIDSIRELLQVRSQAQQLNAEILELDKRITATATKVIEKGEELVKARKVESNMAAAVDSLTMCLPVLAAYAKLQKQLKDKRYYPALRTLEQLEHHDLPKVTNYRFSSQITQQIPQLRENIKDASMSDLRDFLENIRKYSPKIGEVAMRHTQEQLTVEAEIIGRKKRRSHTTNSLSNESEEELSAQDLMDFSPVYRCMHIYTVLREGETFKAYYRQQRKQQARLVLQSPINMHESITGYQTYLQGIVGFFVVEDHILNTGNGLATRAYLDELWQMALSKIVNALRTHSAYCTDATLILKIKNLIMLFNTTLRNYGYSVGQLWDLLQEIRVHYNEVLMQHWVQVFRDILDEDSFLPIQVITQEEYDNVLGLFPYHDEELQKVDFPKKFPFSDMVPKVYQQVKEFIYACLKFSEDLNFTQTEIDEMICKSTNLLLTRTFSGCLSSLFRKPSLALLQVVQIIINTGYLEKSTKYLEEFMSNITGTPHEGQLSCMGVESAMFRVARDDAEKQICEKLKNKLDEFLELENYDWNLAEPQGHASGFITDLIAFLQSTFTCFTNLPDEVAQVACQSACSHIAKSILGIIISDDVKQISMGALQQVNLDTIQCEQFAASEPVSGLPEGILLQYFAQLRQLLDLFMSWDWPTYFHDYGHESSKYHLVSPNMAVLLLEKLKESDKKTVFSVLKKSERDKKKLLETVLKQLRQLAQTTQQ